MTVLIVFSLFIPSLTAGVLFEDDFNDSTFTRSKFRFDGTDRGNYSIEDGFLDLNDNKKSDGFYFSCDIKESDEWDNYIIETELDISMGMAGLIIRNDGEKLYLIDFEPADKVLNLKMMDSEGVLSTVQEDVSCPTIEFSKKIECEIIINDSYIIITIDGNNVLRTSLPKSGPTIGKVGLFSWAEGAPQGIVKINSITIKELYCPILKVYSDEAFYISGESIKISYNIENPCPASNADLYLAVLLPSMKINFYSGEKGKWVDYPDAAISNFEIPRFDYLEEINFNTIPLPSANPAINSAGQYVFAAALSKPGTVDFIGGIPTFNIYYSGSDKREISLLQPDYSGQMSLEEAIKTRRTERTFSNTPLTFKQISQLAWAGQGITEEGENAFKRAAPSAGALYSIDVFYVIGDNCVEGMMAGIYKYIPNTHSFEFVRMGDWRIPIAEASLYQMFQADAPLNVVMTAEYARSTVKYGDRGVQYSHMEVGLISENILLQGVALGLKTCIIGAFYDDVIQDIMQVPEDYIPMIVLSLGY